MYYINEEFYFNGISTATLKSNGQVQNPKNIKVYHYQITEHCKSCLYAVVQWTPSEDQTCYYAISWHDNIMGDLHEVPFFVDFTVSSNYDFRIGDLEFGREYKIAVRSFMHSTEEPKNDFDWQIFVTPQCWEMLTKHEDILEICAPLQPTHVEAEDKRIDKEKYDITISWQKPQLPLPHHYTVTIRNLDHKAPFSIVMDVDGDKTEAEFKGLKITGLIYEATVEAAFANGKRSYTTIERRFSATNESTSLGSITLYIILATVTIFGIISVVVWRFRIDNSKVEVQMLQHERNGSPRIEMRRYRTVEEDEAAKDTPYIDDEFEVDREKVTVLQEIGQGHFGTVYKGILEDEYVEMAVAVKKLKKTPTSEDIRKFILEINIMKSVPKHRNIVSILGHCTNKKDTMLLITEYCSQGSLLNYLRCEWRAHKSQQARWSKFSDSFINLNGKDIGGTNKKVNISLTSETGDFCSVHINAVENRTYSEDCADDFVMVDETHLTMKSLLDIGLQVAEGMKFLALNKVVHRDLAARNILVNHENIAKIADFGLSRDIYEDGLYTKQGNGRVPIKWMALEALSRQVYSTESDVWSFGVLLYEIITLGCIPYPTVQNDQLLVYLMSGSRMEKPSNCSDTLYELMMSCWLENPSLRPTFESIIQQLTDEKDNLVDDEVVDLDKLDKDKKLRRDSGERYLTPITGRPPYMILKGYPGFVAHSPPK
ncbi:tyrosine-protein kinase receptor torso-like isoform X2 [Phlebotomus papatasi]|nr:tyrosine-protein kinase receptor torso-like isoform X2 [Phlebotomus papatasi]